jgi:GH15 family glucan-1,4-alpha-glucosidase
VDAKTVPVNRPVADYALIGDTRTGALCSSVGSIDWLCLPRFDSDPVFGRLVDPTDGGTFAVNPEGIRHVSRHYVGNSAVLETTWETDTGSVRLRDGMVLHVQTSLRPNALLVRQVCCLDGTARVGIRYQPRRGLPGRAPRVERRSGAIVCTWGSLALGLQVSPHLDIEPGRDTFATLHAGETLAFALGSAERSPLVLTPPPVLDGLLDETIRWWDGWAAGIRYAGPFREMVVRSLVTLRLLTFSPSGAPVAAPTTSLPEWPGGGRNWDYRFAWPRDASIGLAAFLAVGKDEEARSFFSWLLHASRLTRPKLAVLYSLYGKPPRPEQEMWDVAGYRDSRPVRVGNGASRQHQLDVYGWLVDTSWSLVEAGQRLDSETWRVVAGLAHFVADRWQEPDAGIWEVRDVQAHYVHSKLMGWLALDRALRIARTHRTAPKRLQHWRAERAAVAADVRRRGFDDVRGCYVRAYGRTDTDAALLLLPVLEFEPPQSNRVAGTIAAIRRQLDAGDGLLYRYPPGDDGLEGGEGSFLACSFWLVQALARLGAVDEATHLFDRLSRRANDVGLLAEEVDPGSGEQLGNFPQALSHAALVQAALALERASVRSPV